MPPCMSYAWTRRLSQVAKSQLARGRPVIECSSCHATVEPTKKITWWVVGLLLLLFWPGAILYVLTRAKNTCPICRSRIQIPHRRPSVTVRQETATPSPSNPAPSSPRDAMAASWRRHRKMILISWGSVAGMVAVLVSLLVLASNGGGGSSGNLPGPALQEPTTPARVRATATPTISDGQRLQMQNALLVDCINSEMANGNITGEEGNALIRRALNVQDTRDTYRLSTILQCVKAGYR